MLSYLARTPWARHCVLVILFLLSVSATGVAVAQTPRSGADASGFSASTVVDNQKRVCVYDANSIQGLTSFARLARRPTVDCAMVYTGSPNWADWVDPWFLTINNANLNWGGWVRSSPIDDRRQLIISQPLIPSGLAGSDWLKIGARGGYVRYAKQLARNLIDAGIPDAVIRLSWEMNGNWNVDSIPDTASGDREWVRFWRRTVIAMRSIRGAHFVFDWCPNNGYRPIPLRSYYPGNDVVSIIGDDLYDAGAPAGEGSDAFQFALDRPDGLSDIIAFARSHHKPLSIPEWGVGPGGPPQDHGDDAEFVRGMAKMVADNNVAFQTYFYKYGWAKELRTGPRSLRSFRAAFGLHGYADGPDDGTDVISRNLARGSKYSRRRLARRPSDK